MKCSVLTVLLLFGLTASLPANAMYPSPPIPATKKYKIDRRGGGKLYTMTGKIQVLSDPKPGSNVLQEYDKGAMMAVIGKAKGTDYLYVSPCNACESGFVIQIEFLSKTKRP